MHLLGLIASRCLNTTADFCFALALLQVRGSCSLVEVVQSARGGVQAGRERLVHQEDWFCMMRGDGRVGGVQSPTGQRGRAYKLVEYAAQRHFIHLADVSSLHLVSPNQCLEVDMKDMLSGPSLVMNGDN